MGIVEKEVPSLKKKAIEQLELDRQFKRKRDAKWYNTTNKEEQWNAQEEELGNFASTGVTIPPDEAI